jgi:hypothetical protein
VLQVNFSEYFLQQDIDVMSWQAKKETELSWQVAL